MDWNPDATGPLAGLQILDLSRLVCGNLLTVSLADFGADVVKVEDAKKGDPLRDWKAEGQSLFWKVYGRNKRSLALDLRSRAGRAVGPTSPPSPTSWSRASGPARSRAWASAPAACWPSTRGLS